MVKHDARDTGTDNENGFRDFPDSKQHTKRNQRNQYRRHVHQGALAKNVTTSTFARHTELFLTKSSE